MQFTTTLATLVLVAISVSAAPAPAPVLDTRVSDIPLSIFSGAGCNSNPTPITTAFIPTDGSCFGISPIVSGNTDSGLISPLQLETLPKGCHLVAYFDSECKSVNFIQYDVTGQCGTFGPGKLIRSAKTIGTCA